jgi:hypothetical protein
MCGSEPPWRSLRGLVDRLVVKHREAVVHLTASGQEYISGL